MRKKISVGTAIVLILFAVLLTFQITYHLVEKEYQQKVNILTKTVSDFSKLAEADETIRKEFYGKVDEGTLEDALLRGYVTALNDPYSRYMTKDEYADYQDTLASTGNGIGVRLTYDPDQTRVIVYDVFRGSPAEQAGLSKGDAIIQIDGKPVSEMNFYDAVEMLSGEVGSTVGVSIEREIAAQKVKMDFELSRSVVEVNTVSYQMLDSFVGYVQLHAMENSTVEEFKSAVLALSQGGAVGLVVDLRNNTGNSLDAAVQMLDVLLPAGDLFKVFNQSGEEEILTSEEGGIDLPISVIVNSSTAGAAEIFATTLRDRVGASIVGVKTYGKARCQKAIELEDGSALLLSDRSFSPISSPAFEEIGVSPDVVCGLSGSNFYLMEVSADNQIQAAVQSVLK